ncbi:siderophore-interacting protein [Brevibacterium sp. BRM-1]|uniref:siderophore-interacting protein n=1 Tax=Brevibacterium sp. BRM-1 TaxID=2999062 RepID=UPI0022823B0F|nr:siderophore-interacting protein [Brevibacterium sp. BRM-1]WAL39384.1 siderophore-interacting protein [Brevibacterium sp. BRM-1]
MPGSYAPFPAALVRRERLSPGFLRLTFADPALARFGTACLDQRVKLVFAAAEARAALLGAPDWFAWWRGLAEAQRPPMRTYTVRAVRPHAAEVDIDFAVHGALGPASSFALEAPLGSELVLVGPVQGAAGADRDGIAWHPGAAHTVLLAGDETAAPAIGNILAALPATARGAALIEVAEAADALDFPHPDGVEVAWLPRGAARGGAAARGTGLTDAALRWYDDFAAGRAAARAGAAGAAAGAGAYEELDEISADGSALLWDQSDLGEQGDVGVQGVVGDDPGAGLFTWVAADAATVARLRRALRRERGLPRSGTSFMGYWRPGYQES